MQSARIQKYKEPLVIEEVPKPRLRLGHQVIVKVGACGLCHSDLHLINGDWKDTIPLGLPMIPGHETAGWVDEVGESVPEGLLHAGDKVAVFGGWGCGMCYAPCKVAWSSD